MFSLIVCWLLVIASAWMMYTASVTLAALVYLLAAGGVLMRCALTLVARPVLSRALLVRALVAVLPLAWYGLNVLVEPLPAAARRHEAEILGAVLPGIAIGCAAAFSLIDLARGQGLPAAANPVSRLHGWVAVNALTVFAVAAFLAANTGEGILLVSTALLAGAETYQTLGDMLAVNLIVVYALTAVGQATPRVRLGLNLSLALLCLATVACAVLVGSNKLLIIALVMTLYLAVLAFRAGTGRWAWPLIGCLALLLLLAGAGLWWVGGAGLDLADLLALTRLLDYGNVDSLLDTPSIASRLEILSDCASRQFALGPIAGDLAAEFRTCGDGHYLHSLLSIQTHLGLVGTLSFGLAVFWGLFTLWRQPRFRLLRLPALLVLGVGLIGAYFTWMPFWFLMAWMLGLQGADARRSRAQT